MAKRNETFDEFLVRFWSNVNQADVANCDPDHCWPWKKPRKHGYGRIFYKGKELQAHRVAYERINGTIPDGFEIDHLCRNPSCVKPSHMEAVPSKENTRRGIGPTAINASKTACPQGHEYTPENTYLPPRGGRYCRICKREKMRVLQANKRAAYRATLVVQDAPQPAPNERVEYARLELAALFSTPGAPTLEQAKLVCENKNPADAQCILNAYEALREAAQDAGKEDEP